MRKSAAGLGVMLLLAGSGTVQAQLPRQDQVPDSAVVVVGIPDMTQFWNATKTLSAVQGLQAFMQSPSMAQNLDYQQFQLEMQKLSQQLGYEASLDQFLGQLFSDAVVFAMPGAGVTEPTGVVLLGVKDQAKARKLVEVLDQKNLEKSQSLLPAGTDVVTTPTAEADTTQMTFQKLNIGGVETSSFSVTNEETGQVTEGYYALTDETFVFSNARSAFEQAVASAPPAQNISASPDYQRLTGVLPWDQSDIVGYVDADAMLAAGGSAQMLKAMPGLSAKNKVAFALDVTGNEIVGQSASTASPLPAGSTLEVQPLEGLAQISPTALTSIDFGLLDAAQSYQQMQMWMGMMGMGMAGQAGAGNPLQDFETRTGISLEQELIPAVGQEVTFAINNLQVNPLMPVLPMVDMFTGIEVKDEAKMRGVMQKLEKALEGMVPAGMTAGVTADQQPVQPMFQSVQSGETEVRTLNVGFPALSPSYAFKDGFVVIAVTKEALDATLARMSGAQPSMASSPEFAKLKAQASSQPFSFSSVDVSGIVNNVIVPYLPMLAQNMPQVNQQQMNQFISQVIGRVGNFSGINYMQDDLTMGNLRITMQP